MVFGRGAMSHSPAYRTSKMRGSWQLSPLHKVPTSIQIPPRTKHKAENDGWAGISSTRVILLVSIMLHTCRARVQTLRLHVLRECTSLTYSWTLIRLANGQAKEHLERLSLQKPKVEEVLRATQQRACMIMACDASASKLEDSENKRLSKPIRTS